MMQFDYIFLCTGFVALALFLLWRSFLPDRPIEEIRDRDVKKKEVPISNAYEAIEPLDDFDWSNTAPIKIRPFKPKFHLTMGLENCPLSELIEIDDTYLDRIRLRREVMDAHPEETVQCNEACKPAVLELYEWLMGTYLPKRFPTMYRLCPSSQVPAEERRGDGEQLYNIPANTFVPARSTSPKEALYQISAAIDTDFLLLLPSSTASDGSGSPIYHLEAYAVCFPSGFSPRQKLSLPLAKIHAPVPGYTTKLEKSMDRFFAKMECGRAVKRFNWSVTTNATLFTISETHMYADGSTKGKPNSGEASSASDEKHTKTLDVNAADLDTIVKKQREDVVIADSRLRCERQTLHRLEKSKALIFTFRTYLYPLDEVKADGDGLALADAIDGLTQGSVPEMNFYKRGAVWGDKVKEYLRS